jgi:ketosteroid isomerase-like protein
VEPPPPIAPPPPNEREAVLTALGHFRAAYESLDADAVAQVFPGVDLPELRRAFKQYKSMSVQIDTGACQTTIDGDRATATCNVTRVIHPKAGESQSLSQRETFQLRKAQQSWVVEAVR